MRALLSFFAAAAMVAAPAWAQAQQQAGGVPVVEQQEQPGLTAAQGRGIEYGGHIVVPIFTQATDAFNVTPGIGFQGRIGWEFPGGLTTELNLGGMWNGSDGQPTIDGRVIKDYSMYNVWVGAGARYSFLNPSAIVPFVGLGAALNLLSNAETFENADGTTTTESTGGGIAMLGVNALGGVAIEIDQWMAVELGVQWNTLFSQPDAADISAQPRAWLTPFVGGTLYY